MRKLRAIYMPDAETKDGILTFKSRLIGKKLYLVCTTDRDIRYEHSVIKQDKDWFIWEVRKKR